MANSVFKNFLSQPAIEIHDGLYCQKNLNENSSFEDLYIKLRKKEGRFNKDSLLTLPNVHVKHPLAKEWQMRKRSVDRLIRFLRRRTQKSILEIGCGNGWLIHYIHSAIQAECLGVDINKTELLQGVNAFGHNKHIFFLNADLNSPLFDTPIADEIVVASSIQYFADLPAFINKLLKLLNRGGQIHILDSPVYDESLVHLARQRSANYFSSVGLPEMKSYYFHHSWESLRSFDPIIMYNPTTVWNRAVRQLINESPFPWIIIKN